MTLTSMTGFADRQGSLDGLAWTWEARGVNGRSLDLRLRLPEGLEALEPVLRRAVPGVVARGHVTIALRLGRTEAAVAPRLNPDALAVAVAAAREAEAVAAGAGLALAPSSAAALLGVRGVLETDSAAETARAGLREALVAEVDPLLAAFAATRRAEGAAIAGLLAARLDAIADRLGAARTAAEARAARTGALLRERVAALLAAGAPADEGRLAQELALLAVRADVTEELDRLDAHVRTARDLVTGGGAVGRRLDFLMQEFNREANTLAAKAQSAELTAIALDIKVLIDQMREQVQNVE
jgi:uncharacterized protein (TIGR00255 family)